MGQEVRLSRGEGEGRSFTQNSHSEVGVFFPLAPHPRIFGEDGGGREESWRVGVV